MNRPHPVKHAAGWLVDHLQLTAPDGRRKKQNEEILLMAMGRREAVREYYVEKISRMLLAVLVLLMFFIAALIITLKENRLVTDRHLVRPDYLEGARQESLSVSGMSEGESEDFFAEEMLVTISGRRFSERQVRTLLGRAAAEWEAQYLGENRSPDEVKRPLVLPDTLLDGAVTATYMTVPYGIIKEDGRISEQISEQGELVEIRATFTCQGTEESRLLTVRVLPPQLDGEASFYQALTHELERLDETEGLLPYLTLPQEVQGRRLVWSYPEVPYLKVVMVLLVLLPVVMWLIYDSRLTEQAKERQMQLKNDYGELMWKMTMLIGAGMTIRATFYKIAATYKENGGSRRYAYEEVVRTCREMRSGISEEQAYEDFGKRCGLTCYIRLGAVLSQNLKKGSKGLKEALEKEAVNAMEDRRGSAKEMGEKAGTKLLLPMVLMLGVVIFVLVAPAFMEMP